MSSRRPSQTAEGGKRVHVGGSSGTRKEQLIRSSVAVPSVPLTRLQMTDIIKHSARRLANSRQGETRKAAGSACDYREMKAPFKQQKNHNASQDSSQLNSDLGSIYNTSEARQAARKQKRPQTMLDSVESAH